MVLWGDWVREGWAMRKLCGVLSVVVLLGGGGASGVMVQPSLQLAVF